MLLPAINPCLVFGLCGYLSETILCESGISAMTVDIYLIPVELGCMEPFETWEQNIQKNYLAQLMPDLGHQQVLTVKLRNFSVLPLENELGNMNMDPGKGGEFLLEIIILYPKKSCVVPTCEGDHQGSLLCHLVDLLS